MLKDCTDDGRRVTSYLITRLMMTTSCWNCRHKINILHINTPDSSLNFSTEFPREQGAPSGEVYHSSKMKRKGPCRQERCKSCLWHHATVVHIQTFQALRRFRTQCSYIVFFCTFTKKLIHTSLYAVTKYCVALDSLSYISINGLNQQLGINLF
jgi:hypothetical protein